MTEELYEKAKKAGSVDEIMALASSEGIELTKEKAGVIFSRLQSEELDDDELDDVAGGHAKRTHSGGSVKNKC